MKRDHKAELALKTRNKVLAAVVASGDVARFRSRTQRSEKSKQRGSRARQPFKAPNIQKVFQRDPHELARLDQSDLSGARGCVSASGAEDMMGNVEEWVRCSTQTPANCTKGACYCLMGRYWSTSATCAVRVVGHSPTYHDYETGFRCCRDL